MLLNLAAQHKGFLIVIDVITGATLKSFQARAMVTDLFVKT